MKVIRPGTLPTTNAPWWVGKTAQCGACGCQVQLEEGDDKPTPAYQKAETLENVPSRAPLISPCAERHPGGKQWVEGPCPMIHKPGLVRCPGKITLTNVAGPLVPDGEFNPPLAKP